MSVAELKEKGNTAFKQGKFEDAVKHFSDAIALDPNNHVLYSNRAAAYQSLNLPEDALRDADKVLSIKPDFAKGYSRRGAALQVMGRLDEASQTFKKGLELDPGNEAMKKGLEEVEAAVNLDTGPGMNDLLGDVWATISKNPELSKYLTDPDFVKLVKEIQDKPETISAHMGDPRIMALMTALLSERFPQIKTPGGANTPPTAPAPAPAPPPPPSSAAPPAPPAVPTDDSEKNLGNDLYKQRKFTEALSHYDKAIELNPSQMAYYTNRAACLFELASPLADAESARRDSLLDDCVVTCEKAIEVGRLHYADFKLIAKAFARIGNARAKQGRFEQALQAYDRSLTENRCEEVTKRKKEIEQEWKLKKERDYCNPELGDQERVKGNEEFQAGHFPEAIAHYSEALKRNPTDARVWSNRAACYMKCMDWSRAMSDCDEALKCDPKFLKAYSRKGQVQTYLKQFPQALKTYEAGLQVDPSSTELRDGADRVMQLVTQKQGEKVDEDQVREATKDPEIQAILRDPVMMNVIRDLQERPGSAQEHLRNPKVMGALNKLVAAGVIRVK